jgi:hypothetical protein
MFAARLVQRLQKRIHHTQTDLEILRQHQKLLLAARSCMSLEREHQNYERMIAESLRKAVELEATYAY